MDIKLKWQTLLHLWLRKTNVIVKWEKVRRTIYDSSLAFPSAWHITISKHAEMQCAEIWQIRVQKSSQGWKSKTVTKEPSGRLRSIRIAMFTMLVFVLNMISVGTTFNSQRSTYLECDACMDQVFARIDTQYLAVSRTLMYLVKIIIPYLFTDYCHQEEFYYFTSGKKLPCVSICSHNSVVKVQYGNWISFIYPFCHSDLRV